MRYTSPDYVSIFFRISRPRLILSGEHWKDHVMKIIRDRENNIPVYNSLYIPENNI